MNLPKKRPFLFVLILLETTRTKKKLFFNKINNLKKIVFQKNSYFFELFLSFSNRRFDPFFGNLSAKVRGIPPRFKLHLSYD